MPHQQNKEEKNRMLLRSEVNVFSGPLPPPEVFEKYELILPGSADRILKMAEGQSIHRHFLEKKVVVGEQFRANFGLFFGFIIGMTIIIGGLMMIYLEKEWQGFILLISGIGSLVGTFIIGKRQKESNLKQKDDELHNRIKELEDKIKKGNKIIDGETL